jgi:hypothetical protein
MNPTDQFVDGVTLRAVDPLLMVRANKDNTTRASIRLDTENMIQRSGRIL